jgi:hypothetical protein
MGEHHERVLLDDEIVIREALVQLVAVFVNDIAERHCDVAKSDRDVASDVGIFGSLQNLKEQPMVLVTELRTDAKELAERQYCSSSKCSILTHQKTKKN